jgi:hypothetical protein
MDKIALYVLCLALAGYVGYKFRAWQSRKPEKIASVGFEKELRGFLLSTPRDRKH